MKSRDLGGVGRKSCAAKFGVLCKRIRCNVCQLSPGISTTPEVLKVGGGERDALREASEPGSQYPNCLGTSQTIHGKRTPLYIHQHFQNSGLREPLFLPAGGQGPYPLWGVGEKVFKAAIPYSRDWLKDKHEEPYGESVERQGCPGQGAGSAEPRGSFPGNHRQQLSITRQSSELCLGASVP